MIAMDIHLSYKSYKHTTMQTSIKKVTNEHEEWKNTLAFYKDEIKIFRNRLNEVAERNNTNSILEHIEKFQNQLDIQDEKISDLKHEIDKYIHRVATETQAHAGHIEKETADQFNELKDKVDMATYLFLGFKFEFKKYIEKVL